MKRSFQKYPARYRRCRDRQAGGLVVLEFQ